MELNTILILSFLCFAHSKLKNKKFHFVTFISHFNLFIFSFYIINNLDDSSEKHGIEMKVNEEFGALDQGMCSY